MVQCTRCGHENAAGGKFCSQCAAPLPLACPRCQALNEPGSKFCSQCAAPLTGDAAAPAPPADAATAAAPSPAPSQAQPTAFAGGRYEVTKFLGEGGKKKVYLAHDALLDRDVAFALIKTEGLDESARTRIRREAQAMGRLGAHPHIVTVFDLGEIEGQPYMVTEFMGGGDVEHLVKKAPQGRVPLERALEIARQVCLGLQFAHGRGIVHRDLKPGNVWLTADGVAKIGDFGLALPLNRPRLTQEGMMVGTVAYMPPEQATGGEVTPRADLYSLGCMLYELTTGRPPFLGDDPVAIIGQHVHTPPVAPSWHNPCCPRDLEALILRLLAKDPAQRPESAAEVLTAVEGVDLSAVAQRSEEEGRSLDSLAGGVFVGRQREMAELKAALEEALAGHGRLVMLVGEPGIGKTRTALELATYAGLRQAQVLWGRCYEGQGMPPYWPWVQALRAYVREHPAEEVRAEMGSGAADIAEICSEVRARFPDLPAPLPLDSPEAARFRLFDSITVFLKSAALAQPLVLILDDLHWADSPSLLLLQFLAGELAAGRLLVVGCYRDVELSRQHPLAQALGELNRQRAFGRVLLRGLTQEDVARFIELTSGIRPPVELVRAVYQQTEGNPFFVNEVVRLLVQEGELSPDKLKERKSWSVRIPEGVREVIGRRLNRLSERCNEVLTIAAVIGREFEMAPLARLVKEVSEERLLQVLEEALAARVIEEEPTAVGRYQFSHALTQETLLGELSLARRVRLHARIAQTLEGVYGEEAQTHAAELAYHYGEAEAVLGSEKVVQYSLLAGERALASYAWEEAIDHFQRGLAAKEGGALHGEPIDAKTADLLFGLGTAQSAVLETSRIPEAMESFQRAFDYAIEARDTRRAVAIATAPLPWLRQKPGPAEMAQCALEMVPPDSPDAGYLLASYSRWVYIEDGDLAASDDTYHRATDLARRHNDPVLELYAESQQYVVQWWAMRRVQSYESALRALRLCEQVGDLSVEVEARAFVTWGLGAGLGDAQSALANAEAALSLALRMRHRRQVCRAYGQIDYVARLAGDSERAREVLDRWLELDPSSTGALSSYVLLEYAVGGSENGRVYLDRLVECIRSGGATGGGDATPWHAYVIVLAYLLSGDARHLDYAETVALQAVSSQETTGAARIHGHLALGLLAIDRADSSAAQTHYEALSRLTRDRPADLGEGTTRIRANLARAAGHLEEALAQFAEVLPVLRKTGLKPELAWTCYDDAVALLEHDAPGDHHKAASLLDEALAIARELGMKPLIEWILSRRKILKA
ncbi:MAG: protein kinase [Anaerolineae bacterium]|nr:protein kinase [Anaerolineae bacterium]